MPGTEINEPGTTRINNVDAYEREKIDYTLKDLERTAELIRYFLEMIRFCDEHGIEVDDRTSLDQLRVPGGVAGPDSDLDKLAGFFESAQAEVARRLTQEQAEEVTRRYKAGNVQA